VFLGIAGRVRFSAGRLGAPDADNDGNQGLVLVAPDAGGPSLACGVAARIAREERGG
jgi:hypothetical protein